MSAVAGALGWASRPWVLRAGSAALAVSIGSVFALAALLVPSPAGHGTHLQLGLGQCTFLTLTGYPCPMCGATTTFALLAHLRPIEAAVNQPFAALLFALSTLVFAVAVAESVDPRSRWTRLLNRIEPYETALAVAFLAAMALSWGYKVARMTGWPG